MRLYTAGQSYSTNGRRISRRLDSSRRLHVPAFPPAYGKSLQSIGFDIPFLSSLPPALDLYCSLSPPMYRIHSLFASFFSFTLGAWWQSSSSRDIASLRIVATRLGSLQGFPCWRSIACTMVCNPFFSLSGKAPPQLLQFLTHRHQHHHRTPCHPQRARPNLCSRPKSSWLCLSTVLVLPLLTQVSETM